MKLVFHRSAKHFSLNVSVSVILQVITHQRNITTFFISLLFVLILENSNLSIKHIFLKAFDYFKDSSDVICACHAQMTHLAHLAHVC